MKRRIFTVIVTILSMNVNAMNPNNVVIGLYNPCLLKRACENKVDCGDQVMLYLGENDDLNLWGPPPANTKQDLMSQELVCPQDLLSLMQKSPLKSFELISNIVDDSTSTFFKNFETQIVKILRRLIDEVVNPRPPMFITPLESLDDPLDGADESELKRRQAYAEAAHARLKESFRVRQKNVTLFLKELFPALCFFGTPAEVELYINNKTAVAMFLDCRVPDETVKYASVLEFGLELANFEVLSLFNKYGVSLGAQQEKYEYLCKQKKQKGSAHYGNSEGPAIENFGRDSENFEDQL